MQIGLAMALGGLIGLEREVRGRGAGLRTMRFMDVHADNDTTSSTTQITVSIRVRQRYRSLALVNSICELDGVRAARWS